MIKKINGRYVVLSETTGRRFGTYDTRAEAEKRCADRVLQASEKPDRRSSHQLGESPRLISLTWGCLFVALLLLTEEDRSRPP